ncbi:MAG: hypothetical protein K6F82_00665 [Sphaerochaetaceae bacterium]|nr:hypothetical protein [Sphaerochaetaceae bacterium]
MKHFSKIILLAAVLLAAVSCSVASVDTGDVKEVTVPVAMIEAVEEPVVEEPVVEEPVVEEPAAVVWEKQLGDGFVVFAIYDGVTYVTVPASVTAEDVNAFAAALFNDYGAILDGVTYGPSENADYEIKGLSKEDAILATEILDMYLDHYVAVAAGAEDVQNTKITFDEDGALVYTVSVNGQELEFKFYKGGAYISYPETVSVESLLAVREALLASYPSYLEGTTVELVEDGLLSVTYPETVTYAEVVSFLSASSSDVDALAQYVPAAEEKEVVKTAVETAVETVKETAEKAVEATKEVAQKAAETVAEKSSEVVEKAKEVVSSIELPEEVEAKKSSAGTVILIIIIVLLVAACAYYFLVYRKKK